MQAVFGLLAACSLVACGLDPPAATTSEAATGVARPAGVYVPTFGAATPTDVLDDSSVDGISLKQSWAELEQTEGHLDLQYLSGELEAAAAAHKKVSIVISAGGDKTAANHSNVPQWVYDAGAKGLTFTVRALATGACDTIEVPVPWDAIYQAKWAAMIGLLATELRAKTQYSIISHIKITGINEQTDETGLPRDDVSSECSGPNTNAPAIWKTNGYRPAKVAAAWDEIAGVFAVAFPDKTLDLQIIGEGFPPIDDTGAITGVYTTALTQGFVDDGNQLYPTRFMVQANGLKDGGGLQPIVDNAGPPATIGYQTYFYVTGDSKCRMNTPAGGTCDASVLAGAIDSCLGAGCRVLELYEQDVENSNSAFETAVACAHRKLLAGDTTPCP